MPNIEPAVKSLRFTLDPAIGQYQYIDWMQCASIVNRRAYRQGMNVAVGGFTVIGSGTGAGYITINRLPETWVMSNAWEKAFRHWRKQQDEALEGQESVKGRFNDFKVYFDQGHFDARTRPSGSNLIPLGTAGVQYAGSPDWDYSKIVVPNSPASGTNWEPHLQMVGGANIDTNPTSLGLIKAYANSRSVPQSPDPEVTPEVLDDNNVFRRMFDLGDNNEDVMDLAVFNNRQLPYNQDTYPGETGDQAEFVSSIRIANTQSQTQVAGGAFACGLVQLDTSALEGPVQLIVHLVPGPSRGYLAESMLEM